MEKLFRKASLGCHTEICCSLCKFSVTLCFKHRSAAWIAYAWTINLPPCLFRVHICHPASACFGNRRRPGLLRQQSRVSAGSDETAVRLVSAPNVESVPRPPLVKVISLSRGRERRAPRGHDHAKTILKLHNGDSGVRRERSRVRIV